MESPQKKTDSLSVAEFRKKLAEQIERAQAGRNIIVTSHGKPQVVLISYAEYMALSQEKVQPTNINFDDWVKDSSEHREVADSIAALFDKSKLNKKGQKSYKKNAVKKFRKT